MSNIGNSCFRLSSSLLFWKHRADAFFCRDSRPPTEIIHNKYAYADWYSYWYWADDTNWSLTERKKSDSNSLIVNHEPIPIHSYNNDFQGGSEILTVYYFWWPNYLIFTSTMQTIYKINLFLSLIFFITKQKTGAKIIN